MLVLDSDFFVMIWINGFCLIFKYFLEMGAYL